MKIRYFQDTDTLYIEFRSVEVAETRDLDENTLLDFDRDGNMSAITIEHARERAEITSIPTNRFQRNRPGLAPFSRSSRLVLPLS